MRGTNGRYREDLYPVSPDGWLQSGDKYTYTVEIAEEVTDWGHSNFYSQWKANVVVK